MKEKFYLVVCIISWIISIGSFITTMVFQIVLSIQRYGVIFGNNTVIIPHWSLAFIGSGVLFGILGWLFSTKL